MSVVVSQLVGRVSIEGSDQAQNNLKQVGTAATTLSDKLQSMKPWNAGGAVSDMDVAQAKLTLLESQVTAARDKLQTLQNAADAGKSVTGIPEAEANLVLLQSKAQQARAGLQELLSGGEEANAGLQQVDSGAQEASSGLGGLLSRLQETAGEMAGGFLSSVRETTSNLASGFLGGVKDVASNLSGGFFGGIKNAATGLFDFTSKVGFAYQGVQAMWQGLTGLGQAFLGSNASMEQTRVAFTQLLGSSKAADAELKDLAAFAAATPFEFPDLATAVQKLLAFQIPLKDTKPLLTAIGDALSGLGKNTPATLEQVVDVFGQMNAAGKIQTQDLMQLTSVGINGFQILADQMHKPVSVIKDMVTNGTIPAKEGIEALRAGMEKTFGGGMQAQATTFNGLLSTFKDNIGQAWRAFTSPLFDKAKQGLTDLGNLVSSKKFQDFATGAGREVGDVFARIGQFVEYIHNVLRTVNLTGFKDAWHALSSEVHLVTDRFGELLQKLSPIKEGFDPIADVIHNLVQGGVDKLSGFLRDLAGNFAKVTQATKDGKGPLIEIRDIFNKVKQVVQDAWPQVEQLGKAFMNFSGPVNLIQALARHSQDLGKWWQTSVIPALREAQPHFAKLGDALGRIVPLFERVAAIVHDNFQKSFDALLPVFEKAIPLLIRISGLIADGLGRAIDFAAPYVEQITKALSDFGREIAERVAPIVSRWLDDMNRDLDTFQKYWNKIWPYLKPIVEGVWDEIVGVVKIAWSIVSGIIKIGLDILGGNWQQAWTDFKDMLGGIWDGIKTYLKGAWKIVQGIFNDAWKGIQAIFTPVGKWFQDRWKDIQNAFGNVGKWFSDRFTEAKNGTTSGFGNIGKWFQDRWKDIQNVFTGIGKWFSDRWNEITKPLKPLTDFIGSIFQTINNIIQRLMQIIVKWLSDRWTDVKNAVKAAWDWVSSHIAQVWDAIYKTVSDKLTQVKNWLNDRWNEIKGAAGSAWDWVSSHVSQVWNNIYNTVSSKVNQVKNWISDRWTDIKNTAASIWGQISGTIGGWWDNISKTATDKANGIKDGVLGIFGKLRDGVGGVFRTFINNIIDQFNNGITAVNNFGSGFATALNNFAKAIGAQGVAQPLRIGLIPHYATGTPADGHPEDGPALVGERGRELVWLPKGAKVATNEQTEQILALNGGKVPGYAGGIGDIASNVWNWIAGGAQSVLNNLLSSANIGAPNIGIGNWGSAIFEKVKSWALSWIDGILPKFSFGGSPTSVPGNVQSWIAAAMALTHVPSSWAGALATIAMHESGGNPNAINNWDINAKNGDPSRGLFQTIGSTFVAYMLPGHGNILNPIDNGAAAIRYIQARYGTVFNVPGIKSLAAGGSYVGYANGGVISEPIAGIGLRTGTHYAFGERGPETVIPLGTMTSGTSSASGSLSNGDVLSRLDRIASLLESGLTLDGQRLTRAQMPYIVNAIRNKANVQI